MSADLSADAKERLQAARNAKGQWLADLEEAYFFSAPMRARALSSSTGSDTAPPADASQLMTALGYEVAGDFATMMISTFLPKTQPWAERAFYPRPGLSQSDIKNEQDKVAKSNEVLMEKIKASNFYPCIASGFNPDLAVGTVALLHKEGEPSLPLVWQHVPIKELEICIGPDGQVDDRFIPKWTRTKHLKAVVPKEHWGKDEVKSAMASGKDSRHCVCWGWWRIYDDPGTVQWQHVLMFDDKVIHSDVLRGAGSCPLIVGRMFPMVEWPWGWGPMIQALPELRWIDELRAKLAKGLDFSIDPPVTYPSEGFAAIADGIESGAAYPVETGDQDAIKKIYEPSNLDKGLFEVEQAERRVRKLHFVDKPEQRGDTPPTLGQWMDEIEQTQRRIGTPGEAWWAELPGGVYERFSFVGEKLGWFEKTDPALGVTKVLAINPAQRAQDTLDVNNASKALQLIFTFFPEEGKAVVDGEATIPLIVEKLNAAGIVKIRNEQDKQTAVQLIAGLMGGQQPGAPAGGAPPLI